MRKFLQMTLSIVLLFVANSASAWKFTVNSPAEGKVDELYQIVLDEPAGTSWVDEMGAMPCTLTCSDGTTYTYNMSDDFSAHVAGTPLGSAEIVAPGTYTLTIPAGTFHIGGAGNEEQTFTWTIGGGEEKSPYTLTYDKAGEFLKLTKDGCTSYEATYAGGATLEGYDGWFSFTPQDPEFTMLGSTCIGAYVALGDGTYTLKVQAGTYKFDGVENEAFEITFTVGEGGGGGGGTGDFDGEKWQEVLFEAGVTSVSIPYTAETEGLSIKTEGREFMGMTLDVAYNTYGEKELDWNNGTKFVITAKDNISGIVMEGQYIAFGSCDKGTYNNGVWSGALMKGETLTLTANDGILVKKITVLYNGDEINNEEQQEEEGKITVTWPVANQVIASIAQGGKLCEFTTNKDYAQVTIELKNNNPLYSSFDLQVRMYDGQVIGEGVAKDIIHNVTTAVPDENKFSLFKGDSYTMILNGYVNMWDIQPDVTVEIPIIGDGIAHEPVSAVQLVSITPAGTPLEPGQLAKNGGKVTLEFSGAVTSVTAVNSRGMEGSTTYQGTAKAGSDNKVWEITLGDLSNLGSGETESIIFNLNITAKASDGVVVFDETKSDFRLEAAWTLVEGTPEPVVALGTPVFSVAEGGEINADDAITIAFPNAENIEAGSIYKVYATIYDKNFSSIPANGEGASPVTLNATLAAGEGYNLAINSVEVYDKDKNLVKTFEGLSFNVNFSTKAAKSNISMGDAEFAADETGITISWPNADLSELVGKDAEMAFPNGITVTTANGSEYFIYPDACTDFTGDIKVEIPYTKLADLDEDFNPVPVKLVNGEELNISIPEAGISIYDYSESFTGKEVYSNPAAITGKVNAVVNTPEPKPEIALGNVVFNYSEEDADDMPIDKWAGFVIKYPANNVASVMGDNKYKIVVTSTLIDRQGDRGDLNPIDLEISLDELTLGFTSYADYQLQKGHAYAIDGKVSVYDENDELLAEDKYVYVWTTEEEEVVVDTDFTPSIADDSTTESLEELVLTFNEEVAIGSGKIIVKKDGVEVDQIDAEQIWPESFTDPVTQVSISYVAKDGPGRYTFEIPEGYFVLGVAGVAAPAIELSYNVTGGDEPEPELAVVNEKTPAATDLNGLAFVVTSADGQHALVGGHADQNLTVLDLNDYDPAVDFPYYKFVKVTDASVQGDNLYTMQLFNAAGKNYEIWGGFGQGYVNFQPNGQTIVFAIGLNNQYGQDCENGGLWEVNYEEGLGYTIKNVANGTYYNPAVAAPSADKVYTKFYQSMKGEEESNIVVGIHSIAASKFVDGVYTMQGVKVNAAQMIKGNIYIVNGKKYLAK